MGKRLIMRVGMLWYDQNVGKKTDVYQMMAAAAAHYFGKFGVVPQRCHIHPSMFGKNDKVPRQASNMQIILDKNVQPKHVWVGVMQ